MRSPVAWVRYQCYQADATCECESINLIKQRIRQRALSRADIRKLALKQRNDAEHFHDPVAQQIKCHEMFAAEKIINNDVAGGSSAISSGVRMAVNRTTKEGLMMVATEDAQFIYICGPQRACNRDTVPL